MLVTVDGVPVVALGIADRLRPDAAGTAASRTALTGDNPRAAARPVGEVGITEVRAGLLPEGKVLAVKERESAGRKVPVVSDCVEDAPALAAAHTAFAMGRAGSDLALETADAVIARDQLATVPTVVALSRRLGVRWCITTSSPPCSSAAWSCGTGRRGHPAAAARRPRPRGLDRRVGLNGLRLLREAACVEARASEGQSVAPGS
ncbi:HAD family hydrolase [Streptomyces sp. NPDC001816]|uniref:HAD family hydrolase n=1 Tax=Streptomyces sp. NPDC001816 TaxID=3364612 RepID=UPI0036A303CB